MQTYIDNLQRIGTASKPSTSLFDNYECKGLVLQEFSLFDYVKLVIIISKSKKKPGNISFSKKHSYFRSKYQHTLPNTSFSNIFVILVNSFSLNKDAEDAVPQGHVKTDTRLNDFGLILLALFVPWKVLPAKFEALGVILINFETFCWQV